MEQNQNEAWASELLKYVIIYNMLSHFKKPSSPFTYSSD